MRPQACMHICTQEPQGLSSPELGAQGPSQGSWLCLGPKSPIPPGQRWRARRGPLTVRTRSGSPSAARGRRPRRYSTGGSGRPPAGSSCRHKGRLWAAHPDPLSQGAWQTQWARDGQSLQTHWRGWRAQGVSVSSLEALLRWKRDSGSCFGLFQLLRWGLYLTGLQFSSIKWGTGYLPHRHTRAVRINGRR